MKKVIRNGKEYFYESKDDKYRYSKPWSKKDTEVKCLRCDIIFTGRRNNRICARCTEINKSAF